MRRLTLKSATVAMVLVAAVCASSAAAARVPAGNVPATIVLPSGWTSTGASGAIRFSAHASSGYGLLQVTSGGLFSMAIPYPIFVSTEISSARSSYRAEDPGAIVTGKQVTFPSGRAVEITVVVQHGTGTPLGIVLFSFLHKGVTYHFTYVTYKTNLNAMRKSFEASARSLTFKN